MPAKTGDALYELTSKAGHQYRVVGSPGYFECETFDGHIGGREVWRLLSGGIWSSLDYAIAQVKSVVARANKRIPVRP